MRRFASFSVLAVIALVSNFIFSQVNNNDIPKGTSNQDIHPIKLVAKEERQDSWWMYTESLPVCKFAPEACQDKSNASLIAAAKMHHDVLGIGGGALSLVGLICTIVGVMYLERAIKVNKQKVDGSDADLEEGAPLVPSSSLTSQPPRTTRAKQTDTALLCTKILVAVLLFIDLNNLMAPQASILATPELLQLESFPADTVSSSTTKRLLSGLTKDPADKGAEVLGFIRTMLFLSWFAFLLVPSRKAWLTGTTFAIGSMAYLTLGTIMMAHSPSTSARLEMASVVIMILVMLVRACRKSRSSTGPSRSSINNKSIENAKKLPLDQRMELARQGPTLIFDGICNLCNGSMSWFQQRCRDDSPVWYMWAQHQDTHAFLEEVGITRQDILKSWAYIEDGIVYRGSTAWLMALGNLRAPWCYLSRIGKLCPTFVRETVYNFVAANRYNALGHSDACQRPNPAMRARFLHTTAVSGNQDGTIPSPQRKRLLVIGCGPAGLFVAKKLAKKKGGAFSVVVVEPKDYYEFTPGILRGMCNPATMKDLVFKLEPVLCDGLGVTFVQGVVTGLDSRRATVKRVPGGVLRRAAADADRSDFLIKNDDEPNALSIDFDFCVVATGSQYATSTLWKVQTNLPDESSTLKTPYTLEGRMDELAREHARLKQLNDQQMGCVSIMGAGLVGVELAGEIRHHFPRIEKVKLFDPMPTVLPPLADSAQRGATQWLQNHNVELVLGEHFNKDTVAAAERDSDVVYRCVGVQTRTSFLPPQVLDERGQVRVNVAMQVERDEPTLFGAGRIFAIGDCVAVQGVATPYVKDIYPAEAMAGVVVNNIHRALVVQCIQTRPGILKEIKPLMVMNLCSLGPNDCIFTLNKWVLARGWLASFVKWMIQYTKMSDSRNEILGRVIWNLIPH